MITTIETALVVDDDVLMREFMVETLRRNKIAVTETSNGLDAQRLMSEQEFDIAFVDLKMPGMGGMELLGSIRADGKNTLVVMVTAFGTVEKAVEAMRIGAYDFLVKPFSPEQVEIILNRAREWAGLQAQNSYLKEELGWSLPRGREIIGKSPGIARLMRNVEQVASSSSTVLIGGESGTGKELVALAIHTLSDRRDGPFIRMNCAAVPDTLMDSELFGHEKGAFTGAAQRRTGRFELAHRGTLLLDEVSEMNLAVQAKLLRVLQEHEFERVGGSQTIRVDSRVIATTNRNLREYVEQGRFRKDLFFRLNVVPLDVPSLRDRREDIPLLVDAFIRRFRTGRKGKPVDLRVDDGAMAMLMDYPWPGNVRELENMMERLCVMEEGGTIGTGQIPPEIAGFARKAPHCAAQPAAAEGETCFSIPEMERKTIMRALEATGGNRRKTAELLEISTRTLRNKLNEYRETCPLPASA